ncbi:hypothetical protein yrohd0001_25260 [Yersinia rohdei ATCC 43380]|nr:hypothetical protein yrohd0001_25260 [Yersinia rohdei ATCC 43380]
MQYCTIYFINAAYFINVAYFINAAHLLISGGVDFCQLPLWRVVTAIRGILIP